MNKGIPPIRKKTLSKKAQEKMIKLKGNYILIIEIIMIRDYKYIGKILSGLTKEVKM